MPTKPHECVPDIFRYDARSVSYYRKCFLCNQVLERVDYQVAEFLASSWNDGKAELLQQAITRHREGVAE